MINKLEQAFLNSLKREEQNNFLRFITFTHEQAHFGNLFEMHEYIADLDTDSTKVYHIKTGEKYLHAILTAKSIGLVKAEIYEGATITDDGTEITITNMNRNSSKISVAKIYETPTATDNGTLIVERHLLGSTSNPSKVSSSIKEDAERIYKPETSYLIVFTGEEDNCKIDFDANFYEVEEDNS